MLYEVITAAIAWLRVPASENLPVPVNSRESKRWSAMIRGDAVLGVWVCMSASGDGLKEIQHVPVLQDMLAPVGTGNDVLVDGHGDAGAIGPLGLQQTEQGLSGRQWKELVVQLYSYNFV